MTIRYVSNADGKGWLTVKYSSNGSTYPPLPQLLKVEFLKTENRRDYFRILEGKNRGKEASVTRKSNRASYLGNGSHRGSAKVVFDISGKTLSYQGKTITAETQASNPPPKGTYDLEIPYEVHALGRTYTGSSKYATTWFRIGHSGDRFLHPGRFSAGCVTVKALDKWTDLYLYLIKSRKGDLKSVGTIQIK